MNSPDLLFRRDRCERLAYWSQKWQWHRILPQEALRQAIETALASDAEGPASYASDLVMGFGAERGFDTDVRDLYRLGLHYAGLAELVTYFVTQRTGFDCRPSDQKLAPEVVWESAAFLDPSGVRLRRIVLASRWSKERELAEKHSWFSLGEVCAYGVPMTMTIFVIGQNREGRHYGPWTKAWSHPLNKTLKFKFKPRKDSQYGANWDQVWREEADIDRETWLDAMRSDGVLQESVFDVEVPVPSAEVRKKITDLAVSRLRQIQEMGNVPAPSPSQCFFPSRCQFAEACWTFAEPSSRLGYTQITE